MKTKIMFVVCCLGIAVQCLAETTVIPPELRAFLSGNVTALGFSSADLDGNGSNDYVLVVQRTDKEGANRVGDPMRTIVIISRSADGKLFEVARNDHAVMCKSCGGVWGDPFAGVESKNKEFRINHFGGSREKWSTDFVFGYSRRDMAWQLIRVEQGNNGTETKTYTSPADFGKIDFKEFDCENWEGVGLK
jgi:hypothetical protein